MKVTREIDVEAKKYFDYLCFEITNDIYKTTHKRIKVDDMIDGFKYQRKLNFNNKKIVLNIEVGPLLQDKYFEVKYETDETSCQYYYDFFVKEGRNYVTYFENNVYKKETFANKLNDIKRKMNQRQLEKNIFNNIEITLTQIKNLEHLGGNKNG